MWSESNRTPSGCGGMRDALMSMRTRVLKMFPVLCGIQALRNQGCFRKPSSASVWEHFYHALNLTLNSPSLTMSHHRQVYPLWCDCVMIWCSEALGGIPVCDIYGPACLWALLTTPTPFNLTAVIYCHCLMTMALANCQLTHRQSVHCISVCALEPECETVER